MKGFFIVLILVKAKAYPQYRTNIWEVSMGSNRS